MTNKWSSVEYFTFAKTTFNRTTHLIFGRLSFECVMIVYFNFTSWYAKCRVFVFYYTNLLISAFDSSTRILKIYTQWFKLYKICWILCKVEPLNSWSSSFNLKLRENIRGQNTKSNIIINWAFISSFLVFFFQKKYFW